MHGVMKQQLGRRAGNAGEDFIVCANERAVRAGACGPVNRRPTVKSFFRNAAGNPRYIGAGSNGRIERQKANAARDLPCQAMMPGARTAR